MKEAEDWKVTKGYTKEERELELIIQETGEEPRFPIRGTETMPPKTIEGEQALARRAERAARKYYRNEKMRRQWLKIAQGIIERNNIKDWMTGCREGDEEILKREPKKGWNEEGRQWKLVETISGVDRMIEIVGEYRKSKGKEDPRWEIEWIRERWPWIIAIWMGALIIYRWDDSEGGEEVWKSERREWEFFLKWWKGEPGEIGKK